MLNTLFIFSNDKVIPLTFPRAFPSRDVPVPKGIIEVLCLLQSFTIEDISSLFSGKTTASESIGSKTS